MATLPIKSQTAIVGIGETRYSRNSGATVLTLAVEASMNAIYDAGLTPKDIDGVITYRWVKDSPSPGEVADALGLDHCYFEVDDNGGGGYNCASVLLASYLVYAGVCNNVLVHRAMNGRSGLRMGRATGEAAQRLAMDNAQYSLPYGLGQAAANFGFPARTHMAKYGTTSLHFAALAVNQRKNAILNKKAVLRAPITIADHQNSRLIVDPYRLLDCCLETDGACAVVVTSAERARNLRQRPIHIMAGSGGRGPKEGLWVTNAVHSAPRLYERAGITPKDVDVAELYDQFTGMCLIEIEDFGFCSKGEGGPFVWEGRNALDGEVPVNTHGGLLSEAYFHGLNHVVEAVRQLRGVDDDLCTGAHTYDRTQCRQVKGAEIALVCGAVGGFSMLLRKG